MRGTRIGPNKRAVRRWSLLLAALAMIWLAAGQVYAQDEWTKIDCASADAHLLPPAGTQANCFQGPFAKPQGQYDCRLFNYSIGFPPDGTEPRFHVVARYPNKSGKVCAVVPFPAPANAMQHVHKLVENGATNWSAVQSIGSDIQAMFFDAKNQKRDGKCFTFIKLGPPAGKAGMGHLFTMIGFFCKAPGQALDAAMAAAMVNAVQLKTTE